MLFIGNNAESVWVPTSNEPIPNGGPTGDDYDQESHIEFMKSFNTITISDSADTIDELKQVSKRKMKKVAKKTHLH